jgi:hypothetical protein
MLLWPDPRTKSVNNSGSGITSIELSAIWLSVIVTPGVWFQSGLVALARRQPTKAFPSGGSDAFFGPKGLLQCRIAEFVVAYRPTARVGINPSFAESNTDQLLAAGWVQIAGIDFEGTGQGDNPVAISDDATALDMSVVADAGQLSAS